MTSQQSGNSLVSLDAEVGPADALRQLSRREKAALDTHSKSDLHERFRRCALAVLNTGSVQDDSVAVLERFCDFDIDVVEQPRGIRLRLKNAPVSAFVDGQLIEGIREQLFAVMRDVLAAATVDAALDTTDQVFEWLREAGAIRTGEQPGMVVCWGGHSIARNEYDYSKALGYQLGLRGLNICTGCGPGAMKGPMKGATIAHAKQRIKDGRYLGITEPGIIAAESPNPIVNELVVMPDVEKRMEAFIRLAHVIVVFPGGVGTAEEVLHLLSVMLQPENADITLPLIFTGPPTAIEYFKQLDAFLVACLGDSVRQYYQIIIGDEVTGGVDDRVTATEKVARRVAEGVENAMAARRIRDDAYGFNWKLHIPPELQQPFLPTHKNMAALKLQIGRSQHKLAGDLRRLFSGIVAGNVKQEGLRAVAEHGPYQLNGDKEITRRLDVLLRSFIAQGRMKLPGKPYSPCYQLLDSEGLD